MKKENEIVEKRELPKDFDRVVKYDENGNEFVVFEPVDYKKIRASLGKVKSWSLNSLLKAGIDPRFSIHTGLPTRIEGVGVVDEMSSYLDSILSEEVNKQVNE